MFRVILINEYLNTIIMDLLISTLIFYRIQLS
jgi:hypothetical protein